MITVRDVKGIKSERQMNKAKRYYLALVFLLIFHSASFAKEWTDAQIVNAIFHAEGGYKATYLYGIRSIPYKDEAEARRICFNTVRNNRKRFKKQTQYKDYLEFLGSRYCPPKAHPLNSNWVKNVKYFLERR